MHINLKRILFCFLVILKVKSKTVFNTITNDNYHIEHYVPGTVLRIFSILIYLIHAKKQTNKEKFYEVNYSLQIKRRKVKAKKRSASCPRTHSYSMIQIQTSALKNHAFNQHFSSSQPLKWCFSLNYSIATV